MCISDIIDVFPLRSLSLSFEITSIKKANSRRKKRKYVIILPIAQTESAFDYK